MNASMNATVGKALFIALFASCLALTSAFNRARFPGPYCEKRIPEQCCDGRDDECTVPIHDTLCYCDQFCDEHSVEDCCPDFQDVCRRKPNTTPRSPELINNCLQDGLYWTAGARVKRSDDCNYCICVRTSAYFQQWSCETKVCINQELLVRNINAGFYGFRASTYAAFDGVSLDDAPQYFLGTDRPNSAVLRLNPIKIEPNERFDEEFDAREEWPGYIQPAMNQGRCAASYAFSTAGVASDRWAIQSKGTFRSHLSVQNIVSCSKRFEDGCDSGAVEDAWYFLQQTGAVESQCYPFVSGVTEAGETCRYASPDMVCPGGRLADVHKTTPAYRIAADERQIMKEIKEQGPVQAIIEVRPDFFLYQSGIYRHSPIAASGSVDNRSDVGTHSVKIIGWGEEDGIKYWRCVNSWGERWGEDGMFKIRRGENESGVEEFVVGVWARVEKHDLHEKKSRRRQHRRH